MGSDRPTRTLTQNNMTQEDICRECIKNLYHGAIAYTEGHCPKHSTQHGEAQTN